MKKTISILLAVLMLVGCMSICFSASARSTVTVGGFFVYRSNNNGKFYVGNDNLYVLVDGEERDADNFKSDVKLTPGGANYTYDYSSYEDSFWDGFECTGTAEISFTCLLASVTVGFKIVGIDGKEKSVRATKSGNNYTYTINAADLENVAVDRLDITFSANPVPGANIGSDYSIDLKATANTAAKFAELNLYTPVIWAKSNEEGAIGDSPDYVTNNGWMYRYSYVAITDQSTGKIVYPHATQLNYAPPKKVSSPTVHGEDANGVSETYEAGKEYYYYATVSLDVGYKFTDDTQIYLNGQSYATGYQAEYIADNLLVVLIDWADVTEKVNTVNIEFSADPKEGKAVGSDYSIKITPSPDMTFVTGKPMANEPAPPAGFFGKTEYKPSYVAIYESNNLLYPGYSFIKYNFAPVQSSDPTGANGNPPAQDNGNTVLSSTPSNYALGKTYKYYAIFEIDGAAYAFDANTVFNVNGVKATDVTLSADGKSAQVFVGEKSATELVVPHQHSLIHFPAVAATTEKEGNVEYWYCDGCKKYFGDAAGNQQLEKVTIEKLTPTTPSNPQNPQGGEDQKPAKTGSCKYCGEDHTGFAGFFIKIIHSILALFGLRKK